MKGKTRLLVMLIVATALALGVCVPAMADHVDPIGDEGVFGDEGLFGPESPVDDDGDDRLGPDFSVEPDCSSLPYVLDTEGQHVCSNNPFTVTQPDGSIISVGEEEALPVAHQTGSTP